MARISSNRSFHVQGDICHLQMDSEDSKWIKDTVEPKFWARLEAHGAFVLHDKFDIVPDE